MTFSSGDILTAAALNTALADAVRLPAKSCCGQALSRPAT